jgi:threonine dehydrogenase-like Zn-dependent dehydrogenase
MGGGPIGQLFIQMIKKSGASNIILSEISDYRAKLGKKNGANFVINPEKENIHTFINKKIEFRVDIIIDAVGSLFEQALKIIDKRGTILIFGVDETSMLKINPSIIPLKELKIVGTFASRFTYLDSIKIVESGLLDPTNIITKEIYLDNIIDGLELLRKKDSLKVMINM